MRREKKEPWLLALIFLFPVLLVAFIAALYFGNCGLTNTCDQAGNPPVFHTPIPTLVMATLPVPDVQNVALASKCTVTAKTLLAAWVNSGHTEKDPFEFTDNNGALCQATFADVQPLFLEGNLWYTGALPCASCHNADVANASANMDLSSYAGIMAGGKRPSPDAKGEDILGGGNWEQSKLNDMLFISKLMPLGRPPGAVAEDGPTILAGTPIAKP